MVRLSMLVGLTLCTSPAIAADQFDLICRGSGQTQRYRVDLAKGEACSDACEQIWKMGTSTTGELLLIDRTPAFRGDLEERSIVNRVTGEWRYSMSLNGRPETRNGRCELAPFSGFPATKF